MYETVELDCYLVEFVGNWEDGWSVERIEDDDGEDVDVDDFDMQEIVDEALNQLYREKRVRQ
jgi:hypothetical protein